MGGESWFRSRGLASSKSKLKTSRFGGSSFSNRVFHSSLSLASLNQLSRFPLSGMSGSKIWRDLTIEFRVVVGGFLVGLGSSTQHESIFSGSLSSSILATFPIHLSCLLAIKLSMGGRLILLNISVFLILFS